MSSLLVLCVNNVIYNNNVVPVTHLYDIRTHAWGDIMRVNYTLTNVLCAPTGGSD